MSSHKGITQPIDGSKGLHECFDTCNGHRKTRGAEYLVRLVEEMWWDDVKKVGDWQLKGVKDQVGQQSRRVIGCRGGANSVAVDFCQTRPGPKRPTEGSCHGMWGSVDGRRRDSVWWLWWQGRGRGWFQRGCTRSGRLKGSRMTKCAHASVQGDANGPVHGLAGDDGLVRIARHTECLLTAAAGAGAHAYLRRGRMNRHGHGSR